MDGYFLFTIAHNMHAKKYVFFQVFNAANKNDYLTIAVESINDKLEITNDSNWPLVVRNDKHNDDRQKANN
jgi:hypothetical protein